MTHADSCLEQLGRSRDIAGAGVATPFPQPAPIRALPPIRRVVLRVWGFDLDEARAAEADARAQMRERQFEITEVITTDGPPCPIPHRDVLAIVQGAVFDRAWAAYAPAA